MSFAATIGTFDGVHLGHISLLNQLKELASARSLDTMVITFSNHPREVTRNETTNYLSTIDEKVQLLKQHGVDCVEMLHFDAQLQRLTAEEFIVSYLLKFDVKLLLLGYNNGFGSDKLTFDQYKQVAARHNIELVLAEKFGDNCSSSQIRQLLAASDICGANKLLGRPYSLQGKVIKGDAIGRTIGFPTANLAIDAHKILPANGVYRCSCAVDGRNFNSLCNIGRRPTINGNDIRIEVHIIDFAGDIYGHNLSIDFQSFIRAEKKFNSLAELSEQISKDVMFFREK